MKLNNQLLAPEQATRLLIGNIPYSLERDEFFSSITRHGKIHEGFLSRATSPDRKNAGWGIVTVDATTAHAMLEATVVIGGRVARITQARSRVA